MNTNITKRAMPALAVAVLTLASVPAFAGVDCAKPQGVGEVRACAKATQGADELRHFIARTQPIYLLSYRDFTEQAPAATAKADNVKVAKN